MSNFNNIRENYFIVNNLISKKNKRKTKKKVNFYKGNVISVDGNIGTGKSTLLEVFQQMDSSQASGEPYRAEVEPIENWTPWFGKFLEGMVRVDNCKKSSGYLPPACSDNSLKNPYLCPFQIKILISYYHLLMDIPYNENVICERTPYTSLNIFTKMAVDDKSLDEDEFNLIKELYDLIGWKAKYQIYISCPPEISLSRIQKRSREGEDAYTLDYITKLHNQHEKIFNPTGYNVSTIPPGQYVDVDGVFIINGNTSADEVADAATQIYKDIKDSE